MYRLFVARVLEAVDRLRDFPRMGRKVPEFDDESLRELIFQNYRIVYKVRGPRVGILAVWHGAMDFTARAADRSWDFT